MFFIRTLSCLCLLLMSTSGALAGTGGGPATTIPLGGQTTHCQLLDQDSDGYRFRVTIGEITVQKTESPAGTFTVLNLAGSSPGGELGGPQLPRFHRLLAIPGGAEVEVEITTVHTQLVDLSALGFDAKLFPRQPSARKDAAAEDIPFHYDPALYRDDLHSDDLRKTERVRFVPLGRLRAVRLGRLEVEPVGYRPQENLLEVADEIELRVRFTGGDPLAEADLQARTRSPFFAPVYSRILGTTGSGYAPAAKTDDDPVVVDGLVTMVVVTPPEYVNEPLFTEFINWKIQRGFLPIVAEVGSAEVGSRPPDIKDYLAQLYEDATELQPAPTFVVFVGDTLQVPTFNSEWAGDAVTDRPYCDVDDDNIPDMFYGRLPAADADQLAAMLHKTLTFDKLEMISLDYLGDAVLVAGFDYNYGWTHANGQINYAANYYFNDDHDITSAVHLHPQSQNDDLGIIAEVDAGVGFVNYTAHASWGGWLDPRFSIDDVNNLTNSERYCFAIGNGCHSAAFEHAECVGETWLRVPDAGAYAYIGATSSSYWDEDYYWSVGTIDQFVSDPTVEGTGTGAYDRMFADPAVAGNVTVDAVIFFGNLAVMEDGDRYVNLYWDIYHLLGDPSLNLQLGVPQTQTVTVPDEVDVAAGYIDVTATPGSYVGLSQGDQLIGGATVATDGSARVSFRQTPNINTALSVVVTGQNLVPFSAYLPLIGTQQPLRYRNPWELSDHPAAVDISFRTVESGRVTLCVYDLAGRLVRELVNDDLPASEHVYSWDGQDRDGRRVASGVYFVNLVTAGASSTQRMSVIR